MPVRDDEAYLPEAIASLEAQSLADFEVLAVDDGSVDGSGALLEAWSARDTRVRVLRQPPRGIVVALERARAHARAPLLARMDGDDIADPGRLEAQLALLRRRPRVVACGTLVEYFPRAQVRGGARRYERWINGLVSSEQIEEAIFVECPLPHPTFVLRAEAVERVGGYRDVGWPEDYDLVLRLWEAGGALAKVPERLLRWRERPGRLSRTHSRYGPGAFVACKVHFLRRTLLAGGRSAVVWGAGPVGKRLSRALREAGTEVEGFVELDPRKIGQRIHGAAVLAPPEAVRVRGPLHLAAVGQPGARGRILATLSAAGLRPLVDFVAAA